MKPFAGVSGLLVALLLAGCGAGEATVFDQVASPDGRWLLTITVAEPRGLEGPFYVAARLGPADAVPATGALPGEPVFETKLENDGVPFTRRNISARWNGATSALLCLRATDRPDRGIRLEPGPPPRAIEVERC